MPAAARQQQAYDHRLRLFVHDTGDVEAARQLGVPRSTAHGWRTRGCRPVVTLNNATESELAKLMRENEILKRRVAQLRAWLSIAIVILKLSRFGFGRCRTGIAPFPFSHSDSLRSGDNSLRERTTIRDSAAATGPGAKPRCDSV